MEIGARIMDYQKHFTRMIEGMGLPPYRQRLQSVRLTTSMERRLRGNSIETFKIINGFLSHGQNMFS